MALLEILKMRSMLVLLVFLPHLIYAQCNDLQLDWGTYSAVPDENEVRVVSSNTRLVGKAR